MQSANESINNCFSNTIEGYPPHPKLCQCLEVVGPYFPITD